MPHSINEAIFLIEKLLNYYNLTSLQELAEKLNIKQSSLSSWKSRNSINAIRNKCRELGIYNDIFGDLNFDKKSDEVINDNLIIINDILLEQAKNEASKFGLDINSYLEHLIIQDLKKNNS